MLAAFVRAELPAVTSEPESWWQRLRLGWLVPIGAAATAVAIWVAVPSRPEEALPSLEAPAQVAILPEQQPSARPEPAVPDQRAPATTARSQAAVEADRTSPPGSPGRQEAVEQRESLSSTADLAKAQPSSGRLAESVAPVAAPAEERVSRQPATPAAAPARDVDGGARALGAARADARTFPESAEFAAPDGVIRWRIAGGRVERSADSGVSWQIVSGLDGSSVIAGAAPDRSVCWLVGRGGGVWLTTDGRQWQQLTAPAPADLAAVSARDGRSADVTAADGRVFRTDDAGATWQQRR
jgi:hypothetical protein